MKRRACSAFTQMNIVNMKQHVTTHVIMIIQFNSIHLFQVYEPISKQHINHHKIINLYIIIYMKNKNKNIYINEITITIQLKTTNINMKRNMIMKSSAWTYLKYLSFVLDGSSRVQGAKLD